MLRGNNKRRLFSYPADYRRFLGYLERALTSHRLPLHALVLMANHMHLLVTPPTVEALSGFVKRFAHPYALYRNRRRGGTGKLFEERYKAIPVTDEIYLATLTTYIELNPVRAGYVEEPFAYPWSTYALQVGVDGSAIPRRLWAPSDWYLALGNNRA